jgi:hypothetical protein
VYLGRCHARPSQQSSLRLHGSVSRRAHYRDRPSPGQSRGNSCLHRVVQARADRSAQPLSLGSPPSSLLVPSRVKVSLLAERASRWDAIDVASQTLVEFPAEPRRDDVSRVIGRRRRIAVPGHHQDRAGDLSQAGQQVVRTPSQLDEVCHYTWRERLGTSGWARASSLLEQGRRTSRGMHGRWCSASACGRCGAT